MGAAARCAAAPNSSPPNIVCASRNVGALSPRHGRHLLRIFARFAGWSYDEDHLIDVCRPRLRLLRLEVFVVDLSFDSNKHDQTRQDASSGADSLHTVAQAAEAFANAQVADMWGWEEQGVEEARQALISAYEAACRGFSSEGDQFRDFGKLVDAAEEDFRRAEEELVRLLAGTESDLASNPFIRKSMGLVGAQVRTAAGTLHHAAAAPVGAAAASMQDDSTPSAVGAQTGM